MNRYRRARGAALLLVLWLVVLLTALVGAFALAARTEHLQGQVLARGLEAREAARAGLEYAIDRADSNDPNLRWLADGREYRWHFGDAQVAIRIVDEQGKIDLNMAGANLIATLLQTLGSDRHEATQVAGAILDWRDADGLTQPAGGAEAPAYVDAGRGYGPANAPLESVAEVEQVLGMTPALYARLASLVTVYSGLPAPRPPLVAGNSGTYSIESRASVRGRTAVLRATVRSGGNGLPGSAWTPLRWEEGVSPR